MTPPLPQLTRAKKKSDPSPRARLALGGNLAGAPEPSRPSTEVDVSAASGSRRWRRHGSTAGAEQDGARAQERWTTGSALATRGLSWLLMAAVAAGPAALVWQVVGDDSVPVAQTPAEVTRDSLARRSVAGEQAAAWVQAWLSTPASRAGDLKAWWAGPVDLPKAAGDVADVRVVDAVATAPGVWAVTVTATVTEPGEARSRRFYMVPVQVDGGAGDASASVKAVPAVVQAPAAAVVPASPYTVSVPSGSAVIESLQAFMSAYLAGQGDVARYITPGSPLGAVSAEAQYERAEVESVRVTERVENLRSGQSPTEGQTLQALVEVRLVERGKGSDVARQRSASWPLTLTARDGRWEITAIDGTFQTTAEASAGNSNTTPKE